MSWKARGREEWLGAGDQKGELCGPYICFVPSQAADMRARLWTYILGGPISWTHLYTVAHSATHS